MEYFTSMEHTIQFRNSRNTNRSIAQCRMADVLIGCPLLELRLKIVNELVDCLPDGLILNILGRNEISVSTTTVVSPFLNPPSFVTQGVVDWLENIEWTQMEFVCNSWRRQIRYDVGIPHIESHAFRIKTTIGPDRSFARVRSIAWSTSRVHLFTSVIPDRISNLTDLRLFSQVSDAREMKGLFVALKKRRVQLLKLELDVAKTLYWRINERDDILGSIAEYQPRVRWLKIKGFSFDYVRTEAISALEGLTSLDVVSEGRNVDWIAALSGINTLRLRCDGALDLIPLLSLPRLTELKLRTGLQSSEHFRGLDRLVSLESLEMGDMSPWANKRQLGNDISRLTNLRELSTELDDLTPLYQLTNLTKLCCRNVTSLNGITELTRLVDLKVSTSKYVRFKHILSLIRMERLQIDAIHITREDLIVISQLPVLREFRLHLEGVGVASSGEFSGVPVSLPEDMACFRATKSLRLLGVHPRSFCDAAQFNLPFVVVTQTQKETRKNIE
jgi:hypothetical protein